MDVFQEDLWAPVKFCQIQFPTMRVAHGFVDSADYAPVKDIRLANSNETLMVLEGL